MPSAMADASRDNDSHISSTFFEPDNLVLQDAAPAYARRSLLLAAQEMSSRGLDHGANWALDLANCLPASPVYDSSSSSSSSAHKPYHWTHSTPARSAVDLPSTSNASSPVAPMYPMQSTPFLGVQAPSSSSFRQDLSSPAPIRLQTAAAASGSKNSNNNTLSPIPRGAAADHSTSGRFPPPFRHPPSPLSNLSFSADEDTSRRKRGAPGDVSHSHPLSISHGDSSDTDESMQADESMQSQTDLRNRNRNGNDAEDDDGDDDLHSAHVRFASEGKDSSVAESDFLNLYAGVGSSASQDRSAAAAGIDSREATAYEYALSCFRLGQLDRCKWQLDKCRDQAEQEARRESHKTVFLRGYVGMLILERKAASESVFALPKAHTTPSHTKAFIPLLKDGLIDPQDAFLLLLKGIILRKLHKRIEAMDCFIRSLTLLPYNWTAWLELSSVIEAASGELDEILPLLPESFMTLMFLEYHHRQSAATKDPQANADRLEKLLDIFPENAALWNSFAMQRYLQRDFDTAIEFFQKARSIDPYLVEGLADYSNALFLTDRGEQLAHLAHTTSTWGSETSEVCCVIGNHLYYQSDQIRAIEAFKRAIKLDPNSLAAWILLGHGYVEVKNTSAAMEMYRRAIEINPRDFRPWHGLGKVYELMDAWSFAAKYYLKAAGLAPYTSQVWQSLGVTYTRLQMPREAISAYQRHLSCETSQLSLQLNCIKAILDLLLEMYSKQNHEAWTRDQEFGESVEGKKMQEEIVSWHCVAVQFIHAQLDILVKQQQNQDSSSTSSSTTADASSPPGAEELGLDIDANPWIIQSFIQAAKADAGCPATFQPSLPDAEGDIDIDSDDSQPTSKGTHLDDKIADNTARAQEYLHRILLWSGGLHVESTNKLLYAPSSMRFREEAYALLRWFQTQTRGSGKSHSHEKE